MSKLTVIQNEVKRKVEFIAPRPLGEVLIECGFLYESPCGGRGMCKKCAVQLSGEVSEPNECEKSANTRLICQAVLLGDACAILPKKEEMHVIETDAQFLKKPLKPMEGKYGGAVDIGTTTVALKLFELETGRIIGESACVNPQNAVAADVMGRIDAAMNGRLAEQRELILGAIDGLLNDACKAGGIRKKDVGAMVAAGNTTMLYLLCGIDPKSLARYPFISETLFDVYVKVLGIRTFLPPCMNAFVGADITCAVLLSGMTQDKNKTSLLCDIGTNGEIALYKDGTLYVTSTAAGPAFEGAGIECGTGSILGAVDRVFAEDGKLNVHTIGDMPATGICGSGIIDAVSAMRQLELIDETGAMDDDKIELSNGVYVSDKDIRAVQLAKAAIAAGIKTLLKRAEADVSDVDVLYIAGGFGSHLDAKSAADIGMIPPELADRIKVMGNAALAGAASLLLNTASIDEARAIAEKTVHVNLGGDALFNELYVENMLFMDEEL